jgi:hypothetical protein
MTSSPGSKPQAPGEVYVWVWLPGQVAPVVAGRLAPTAQGLQFNYGQSYLARDDAISLYTPELAQALQHGTSIGGARPKALITDGERKYIAKFSSTTELYNVVKTAFIAMRLAALVGIEAAPVKLAHASGKDVLLVERFDRLSTPAGWQRKAMLSSRTLLGLDEMMARYAIVLFGNGEQAKIDSITSRWEHFNEWKRLAEEAPGAVDMENLLKGVCDRTNFLDLVENFILLDESAGKPRKIIARNHQFLGVNRERIAEKLEELETDDINIEQRLERELKRDYHVITAGKRLDQLARDFWETGKAMLVCIDKMTCVRMHKLIEFYWEQRIRELEKALAAESDAQQEIFLHRQIAWMRETRMAVVVSEEQGEVDKFRRWDLDITPHRKLMKEGIDLPEAMRARPEYRNLRTMALDDALKAEKLRVDQWRDKEATRDAVRLAIRDHLWDDTTGLPVDRYTEDDVGASADEVFRHVLRAYPTVPSPFYAQSAQPGFKEGSPGVRL